MTHEINSPCQCHTQIFLTCDFGLGWSEHRHGHSQKEEPPRDGDV